MGLPENTAWAETEDARRLLRSLQAYLDRWKAAGHDVRDLEGYLGSPDITPRGIDYRLRVLLKRIDEPWPGEIERLEPITCPTCGALAKPQWETCTSCGAVIPRAIFMSVSNDRKDRPDTDDDKERLAALRSAIRGWKDAGYDVSELETYLDSPDATPEGVNYRLEAVIRTITKSMRDEATRSSPPECPNCYADLTAKDVECPSCGAPVKRPGQAAPADRCPECKSRVKPGDRKCPICGRRLRAWRLF